MSSDVGASASFTVTAAGAAPSAAAIFAGGGDDPYAALDLAVDATRALAVDAARALAVSPGLAFTGESAAKLA